MKIAYIICVNDSTEAVVIDDMSKALKEKDRLKKEHQKKIPPCKEYEDVFFWHLHDVPVV
jgi:hypothetical protein